MREREQEIEKCRDPGMGGAIGDHFRSAVEGGDQRRYGEVDENTHKFRHNNRTENTEPGSLFGPVVLFGAQILTDESGERHGKAGDGQKAETFYLGIGTASGDSHFAKFIDVRLYDYIGQGNDGVLKACGQTVRDDLPEHWQVKPDLPYVDTIFFRALAGEAV